MSKNRLTIRRDFDNMFTEEFAEGAARAAFVSSWADYQEERGKTYPGKNLMDVAPSTPLSAYVWAGQLIGKMEELNSRNIHAIGAAVAEADGLGWMAFDGADFGHYMAMQALGHGVSWSDDHSQPKWLKVPYMEYDWFPAGR